MGKLIQYIITNNEYIKLLNILKTYYLKKKTVRLNLN